MMLPANAASLRELTYFSLWYLEIIVYEISPVGGERGL